MRLCGSSTVVKHSPQHPKVKGSSPAFALEPGLKIWGKKLRKICQSLKLMLHSDACHYQGIILTIYQMPKSILKGIFEEKWKRFGLISARHFFFYSWSLQFQGHLLKVCQKIKNEDLDIYEFLIMMIVPRNNFFKPRNRIF